MNIKEDVKELREDLFGMIKWLIFAGITGAIVGLIGVVFGKCMTAATDYRAANDWVIYLLPVAGVLIIWMHHLFKVYNPKGTNLVFEAVRAEKEVPAHMAPLIFISTVLTHFVGGSAGREGAALQLGGSIGNVLGKFFRFDEEDRTVVVMCGMSAAFAALFGTPLAAAIFPMEVVCVGIMKYSALVPCVVSSIVASRIALAFHMHAEAFPVEGVLDFTAKSALLIGLLAILCAIISIVFCELLHKTGSVLKKNFKNPYIRAAAGGAIILVITLLLGTRDYMGAGVPIIERAMEGEVRPEAFLLKMILTAITLGCGFKGGEIVPSFFVGATFGAWFGQMIGMPMDLCAACGMAAVFCGVTNCPISTLFISFEMFGFEGMLYYVIAVAVSYMVSGYTGLYHSQKIMYSKVTTECIDRKAR